MTSALRATQPHPARLAAVSNAALELDRYLPEAIGGNNDALQKLLDRVCGYPPPAAVYAPAFARWHALLAGQATADPEQPAVRTAECRVQNRLIVGLGAGSVRDASITLHRAYGVPLVPGSALKGLARRYALAMLPEANPADPAATGWKALVMQALFGEQADASHVVFFDAWYVPKSAVDDRPLRRDVMTVHHPGYYGSQGGSGPGPWDLDDPTPIPFVSATGHFLVAVKGPTRNWADFALQLLMHALADWGVGAKTSSGYGRLVADTPAAS